jgi:hypothetical protein
MANGGWRMADGERAVLKSKGDSRKPQGGMKHGCALLLSLGYARRLPLTSGF